MSTQYSHCLGALDGQLKTTQRSQLGAGSEKNTQHSFMRAHKLGGLTG